MVSNVYTVDMALNGLCLNLLRYYSLTHPVCEMTYTVTSGTLNSSIPYHHSLSRLLRARNDAEVCSCALADKMSRLRGTAIL